VPGMNMGVGTGVKSRLFYGWWIVAAGIVIVGYGSGTINYALDQVPRLVKELGGTVSQSMAAMTIFSVIGIIALLAIGPFIDRYGPRKIMIIGITIASITILAFPYVNSLLYIFLGTLAIGTNAGFLLPVQTATANWFMKRRSLALAVVCAASVLGSQIADQADILKSSYWELGVGMLVIGVPLAFIFKHKPEQFGLLPDGRSPVIEETSQSVIEKDNLAAEVNFTLRQALRTKAFWILTVAIGLANGAGFMAESQKFRYLVEKGFDYRTTNNFFELAPLVVLVWMLLFGFLGDKFPKRYLLSIAAGLQSISVVVLLTVGNNTLLYQYILAFGFGSVTMPLILAIRADYFGRKAFATITVVMGVLSAILSTSFVPLGGLIYDIALSNQTVFLVSILVGFIAAIVFFFVKPPELQQQILAETES